MILAASLMSLRVRDMIIIYDNKLFIILDGMFLLCFRVAYLSLTFVIPGACSVIRSIRLLQFPAKTAGHRAIGKILYSPTLKSTC